MNGLMKEEDMYQYDACLQALHQEETMAEKQCAHPSCTCVAEAWKGFCSNECRNARTEGMLAAV